MTVFGDAERAAYTEANIDTRADTQWEYERSKRRCHRCLTRPLPDVDADSCIPCMTPFERRQWIERRAA